MTSRCFANYTDTTRLSVIHVRGGRQHHFSNEGSFQLKPKEVRKPRGLASPILADAIAVNFGVNVALARSQGIPGVRGLVRGRGISAMMV